MKVIPFEPSISSIQTFSINLGELVCEFTMSWNDRDERWYCDFKTSEGENDSVRIVENSFLLGSLNRTGLKGDFRVVKANRECNEGITYDNIGTDWIFVFGTNDEWSEALGG